MVYNGDNQGIASAKKIIFDNFFSLIVRRAEDKPIADTTYEELAEYSQTLKLFAAKGEKCCGIVDKINGVTYKMQENPMGITKIKLSFNEKGGVLCYANAQGYKEIPFGMSDFINVQRLLHG